jgi:hypothetical protein
VQDEWYATLRGDILKSNRSCWYACELERSTETKKEEKGGEAEFHGRNLPEVVGPTGIEGVTSASRRINGC